MRAELARLHGRLQTTSVFVTHDQVEAMTLGQRVAVMREGVFQQCARPQELFHEPVNLFVASFIGSPSMNLVEAEIESDRVGFAGHEMPVSDDAVFFATDGGDAIRGDAAEVGNSPGVS